MIQYYDQTDRTGEFEKPVHVFDNFETIAIPSTNGSICYELIGIIVHQQTGTKYEDKMGHHTYLHFINSNSYIKYDDDNKTHLDKKQLKKYWTYNAVGRVTPQQFIYRKSESEKSENKEKEKARTELGKC